PVFQNGTLLNICKERCYDLRIDAKIEGLEGKPILSNVTNGTCLVPPNLLTNSVLAYLIVFTLYENNFTYRSIPFFVDVSSTHPHFKYIQRIRQDNIMLGFPLFCVDRLLSREELYTFVVRYLLNGQDLAPGAYSTSPYFPDVTPSVTGLFPYIQKAYELGLIYGTQPGSNFYPFSQPSTREIYEVFKKININVLPKICSLLNIANCDESILSDSPANLTRGQFAFLMVSSIWGENFNYRLLGYFDDVLENNPYFKYVQKFAERRITHGCGEYRFYPDKFLTREKLYEAAVRYKLGGMAPSPGTYSERPYFPDVTNETVRGFSYIQKAEELGLVVHTTIGNNFRPYEHVTLSEVVEVFERAGLNLRDTVCQLGGSIFVPVPVRCEEDGEGLYIFDSVSGKCVSVFSLNEFPYYQVAYLYNRVLNRSPEGKGYAYWTKTNPCFQGEYSLSCLEYYVKAAVETLDRVGYDAPCGIDLRTKPCHSVTDETGMPLSVRIMAALIASSGTCPPSSTFDFYCNNKIVPIVDNVIIPQPRNFNNLIIPQSKDFTNRLCPIPDYLVRNFGFNALLSGNLTQTFDFRIEPDLKCSYVPRCDDGSYPRLVDGVYICGEVLGYSNNVILMTYDWSSKDGTKKVTVRMKKGIFIEGILRAYGDGCFIQSYDLALCVLGGGSRLRFSFKHPDKGFRDLEVSLRPKWYNEFTAFITPEMIGLSVKDTGSGRSEFKEVKLGYAPVDKDDPSRVMTIDLTLTPLKTDPLEVVVLRFYTHGRTSPFCPDKGVAYCFGNNAIVNIQQQGVRVTSGNSTPSATNYCTPAMISVRLERGGERGGMVYSFNFNGTVEENINNIGDMFRYRPDSEISAGLCLYWKTTDNMTGFIQKLNRNGYVESYGYKFDFIRGSIPIPKQIGVYRVRNDFVGNVYFGRESNRKPTWIPYSLPTGFYSPLNIELREPRSNEVFTNDGYFEKFSDLCPTGQVELYGQRVYFPYRTDLGTGKCFTYVEPADCYHSSMNGYDIDKFGDMCHLQVGVPDQCPSGTYLLTPYTSPSDDYKCEHRRSPTCPSWTIRIGDSCYEFVSPSVSYCQQNCGSTCFSCSYLGNGLC
ncbi:MAG: S-layer homology domain-containing protein, partial [Nanopusillaceae archaeon]